MPDENLCECQMLSLSGKLPPSLSASTLTLSLHTSSVAAVSCDYLLSRSETLGPRRNHKMCPKHWPRLVAKNSEHLIWQRAAFLFFCVVCMSVFLCVNVVCFYTLSLKVVNKGYINFEKICKTGSKRLMVKDLGLWLKYLTLFLINQYTQKLLKKVWT